MVKIPTKTLFTWPATKQKASPFDKQTKTTILRRLGYPVKFGKYFIISNIKRDPAKRESDKIPQVLEPGKKYFLELGTLESAAFIWDQDSDDANEDNVIRHALKLTGLDALPFRVSELFISATPNGRLVHYSHKDGMVHRGLRYYLRSV